MMNVLMILNDPPYGTERSYNPLRLAGSLTKREGPEGVPGAGGTPADRTVWPIGA